jgi:hypothetical protein
MKQNRNAKIASLNGKLIDDPTVRKFERHFLGEILHPGEECYEAARRVWNGMIDPTSGDDRAMRDSERRCTIDRIRARQ